MGNNRLTTGFLVYLLLAHGLNAEAGTLTVCASSCDYASINAAVQAAEPGDTVLVQSGVYVEHVGFPGGFTGITVKSVDGPFATIIDYQRTMSETGGHVVSMGCACGDCAMCPTVLDGFRIKGGWSSSSAGGVQIAGGVIKNCIIENNKGHIGGGIEVTGGEPVSILTTIIQNNQARDGGGIAIKSNAGPTEIWHSEITGNTATREGGGGITVGTNSWVTTIRNTPISGNTANNTLNYGAGGGLRILWQTELINSPVSGNTATGVDGGRGGGIYLSGTGMSLSNSPVTSNQVSGIIEEGAGIYCRSPLDVISSSLVHGNTPDAAKQIFRVNATNCKVDGLEKTSADSEPSGRKNDPVDTYTGELFMAPIVDIALGGPMPLTFSRYYSSGLKQAFVGGRLGNNWLHSFEARLSNDGAIATVVDEFGRTVEFQDDGGIWMQTGALDRPYELLELGGEFLFVNPDSDLIYIFDAAGPLQRIDDGKGNVHTLTYDVDEKLLQVSDGLGRTLTFTYDGLEMLETVSDGTRTIAFGRTLGNLTSFTDLRGNSTTYQYDAGHDNPGLMTAEVRPETNSAWTQTYDVDGRVATQLNAFADTWSYAYDDGTGTTTVTDPDLNDSSHLHSGTGELLTTSNELGDARTHQYNLDGRRTSTDNEDSETTAHTYHAASGKTDSVVWPDGTSMHSSFVARVTGGATYYDVNQITFPDLTTQLFAYDANGNVTLHTDRAGQQTVFTHDANGQVLTKTNPRLGITTYTYNADGTRATIQDDATNVTSYAYDGLRRLTTVTRADATTLTYAYDDSDNLLSMDNENGEVTTYTYDNNDNVVTVTTPLAETTTITYDSMDRLSTMEDPLGQVQTTTYDALGRITTLTNRNGFATSLGYDAIGRLISTTRPGGAVWSQGYDKEGSLNSVTDPLGKTTNFTYDSMARLTAIQSPMGNTTSYEYDSMGRVAQSTDAMLGVISFDYDNRGDLVQSTIPGGISSAYERGPMGSITKITDPNNNEWLRGHNNLGQITSKTDPLARTTTYDYDVRKRVSTVTLPGGLGNVIRTYDGPGNITRQLYSDGTDLNFSYDANGRLTGGDGIALVRDANSNIVESNGLVMSRDNGGRITTVEVAPGKTLTYAYSDDDQLTMVSDWAGGSVTLNYDLAGRVTSIARSNGVTTTNTYDDENRLIFMTEVGGTINTSIDLARDASGRIAGSIRTVPLDPDFSALVGETNSSFDAALQDDALTHDAMGRVTVDGPRTYNWDLASRLEMYTLALDATFFTYDAFGNVLSRSQGPTTRTYTRNLAFGYPCATIIGDGISTLRYFVCTPEGELLYSIEDSDNSRQFYHYDERGSTLLLSDDFGEMTDAYAYDPLGRLVSSTGTSENPFVFMGRYGVMQEGVSGLYRTHRRIYDSVSGRFLSQDPMGDLEDPRLINPYQYAMGDPIQNVDPAGEDPEDTSHNYLSDNRALGVVQDVARRTNAVLGKHYGDQVTEYSAQIDSIDSVNKMRGIWNLPPENVAKASRLTKVTKNLGRYIKNFGRAAAVVKYGSLALETYEKGPDAAIQEGFELAAEKGINKTAGRIVGVAAEGLKTKEAVEKEVKDMARNQDSSVSALDKATRYISEMYCRGDISYAKAHLLHKRAQRAFAENMDGNTDAGNAAIWQRLLEGFNKMLGKAYGV